LIVFLLLLVFFIDLVLLLLQEFEIVLGVLVVRIQFEGLLVGIDGPLEIPEPVLDVPLVVERAGLQLWVLGGFGGRFRGLGDSWKASTL